MAESTEPPMKKAKRTEDIDEFIQNVVDSNTNLLPILDDVLNNSIPLVKCYAGHIRDTKQISLTLKVLNEKLPLNNLNHLKRVNKHSVLLCTTDHFSKIDHDSVQEFIEHHVPELKDVFEYIKHVEVPLVAPVTKKQNNECNRTWTCNFHPNKYIEKMLSGSCFNLNELRLHRTYMGMAFHLARLHLTKDDCSPTMHDLFSCNVNAAVIVDPIIKSVVTVAFDNRQDHPIQHAAMLAIDNVAITQNGGAWNKDKELMKEIIWKLRNKFVDISFGARPYASKKDSMESNKNNNAPYLCTGYDIYLLREPCLMCAMGLVHARIKRVFYAFENHVQGAVRSKAKLHCLTSLNHRFEVFTGFEN